MYHKYKKYKTNYLRLKYQQDGGSPNMILLEGTSSSGKTTIAKLLGQHGYFHIANDDYGKAGTIELMKTLPNDYISKDKLNVLGNYNVRKAMYSEAVKHNLVVFDDIESIITQFNPDIYVIIVYASLHYLTRNILDRRFTDPRSINVYRQYARKYVRTDGSNKIDTVNKPAFITMLKKMKYEFASEEELLAFADKIFLDMGIDDDQTYGITIRDQFKYDYLLNTNDKTPEQIVEEITGIIKN